MQILSLEPILFFCFGKFYGELTFSLSSVSVIQKSLFPYDQHLSGDFLKNYKIKYVCPSFIDGFIACISMNDALAKMGAE